MPGSNENVMCELLLPPGIKVLSFPILSSVHICRITYYEQDKIKTFISVWYLYFS